MLRTIVQLRPTFRRLTPARAMSSQDKTRQIITEVEHIIKPVQKPPPEFRGREAEAFEPSVFVDDHGKNVSPLGHSRSLISRLQEPVAVEPQDVRYKLRMSKIRALRQDQQYSERGLLLMGPDLLAARFLIPRGGKVKFKDDDWMTMDNLNILGAYTKEDNPKVEAVEAVGASIVYEGFDYLRGLKELRYLDVSKSHRLDDHCLAKIAFHIPTLEYLNISECPNVSERGIATLHSLKNLRKLVVGGLNGVLHKQLVCLLLEEENPNLFIKGVEYSSESIDSEIENDRKKYEQRYDLREIQDYEDKYISEQVSKVRIMEKILTFMPKSSESGFLAKYFGHKGVDSQYSRVKDEF